LLAIGSPRLSADVRAIEEQLGKDVAKEISNALETLSSFEEVVSEQGFADSVVDVIAGQSKKDLETIVRAYLTVCSLTSVTVMDSQYTKPVYSKDSYGELFFETDDECDKTSYVRCKCIMEKSQDLYDIIALKIGKKTYLFVYSKD
jgi:hypothetical protein